MGNAIVLLIVILVLLGLAYLDGFQFFKGITSIKLILFGLHLTIVGGILITHTWIGFYLVISGLVPSVVGLLRGDEPSKVKAVNRSTNEQSLE